MTFGLSMDYEIFLLTRIRERFLQSGMTRDAVAYGVSTSARTITSAALIMIAVFIGFAFAGMPLVAEIGVACAVAIAVDATVVRLVLVPALMAMFAQWNWWLPRVAVPRFAVGRLRPAAARGRPRRHPGHPRRHFGPDGAQCRPADGAQVGRQAQALGARRHVRGRPAGLHRRAQRRMWADGSPGGPKVRREGGGRRERRRPRTGTTVTPTAPGQARSGACAATASPGRLGGRCTRSRCGAGGSRSPSTRWRARPTPRTSADVRTAQPGGDHPRATAHR